MLTRVRGVSFASLLLLGLLAAAVSLPTACATGDGSDGTTDLGDSSVDVSSDVITTTDADATPVDAGCSSTDDKCPAGTFCSTKKTCEPGCKTSTDCKVSSGDAGPKDVGASDTSPSRDAGDADDATVGDATTSDVGGVDGGTGGALVCNDKTHACVECLIDTDCPSGTVCDEAANKCVAGCTPTKACPSGGTCCSKLCSDTTTDFNNCGGCGTKCTFDHARPTCVTSTCAMGACIDGYYDLDGDAANGCEYSCSVLSPIDDPDDGFVDTNCDGIDGDASKAIFVATDGNDSDPGTMKQPMLTINAAIAKAKAGSLGNVYVSAGTYSTVRLESGISIWGGFLRSEAWKRDDSYVVTILGNTVTSGRITAVEGFSVTAPTTLAYLTIKAADATTVGTNTFGVRCQGCSGLMLRKDIVIAGSGGPGSNGASGGTGGGGSNGASGFGASDCDNGAGAGGSGGSSACGRSGGGGGNGGPEGANNGAVGGTGVVGVSGGFGGAGESGTFSATGHPGGDGSNGSAGASGGNGAGGTGGSVVLGVWVNSGGGNGVSGSDGNGGGGGGGGGGQGGTFVNDGGGNGGGGGGGAGCGGSAGMGGTAGGSSFGILLQSSSGADVTACTVSSGGGGGGGAGGTGGNGGTGASGGSGAAVCTGEVGAGGRGGNGGNGGSGGHGGGGSGGSSYAIYLSSTTAPPSLLLNTFAHGAAGLGGNSAGNKGVNGTAANSN